MDLAFDHSQGEKLSVINKSGGCSCNSQRSVALSGNSELHHPSHRKGPQVLAVMSWHRIPSDIHALDAIAIGPPAVVA